jgi:dTDP-4-dehydrorhamnose reductase
MNILVTGANGQLGNEMRIISRTSADTYIFTDVNQVEGQETTYLDITDMDAILRMVKDNDIKAIVNCAAWTNVDACETDEKLAALAMKLNADAPKNLADAMAQVNGVLFHVSTDYVFGKEPYNTPCSPSQTGTPTGVYGATKLQGEKNIVESGCRYIILRTAWLYSEFGKNFCKTMLNLTATKPQLKVVFDQCGTPTYAYDLASAIFSIIEARAYEGKTGIYHYSNEGVTSWYDFTVMIAKIAGHVNCDIQPCYSSEYPSPVKRPAYSVLDKKTFKETFGLKVPYWIDSLETCIQNIQSNEA